MDTHQAFNLLLQKGFTKEQAEGLIEVVGKVHEEIATKQDLIEEKKDLLKRSCVIFKQNFLTCYVSLNLNLKL